MNHVKYIILFLSTLPALIGTSLGVLMLIHNQTCVYANATLHSICYQKSDCKLTIQYTVNEKIYIHVTHCLPCDLIGSQLKICYENNNPENISENKKIGSTTYVLFLYPFLFVGAYSFYLHITPAKLDCQEMNKVLLKLQFTIILSYHRHPYLL